MVHFYDTEKDLVALVGSYLSAATLGGDAVAVIGTAGHLSAFRSAMAAAGVDVGAATEDSRLILLDADEMLSRFMVGGSPSPAAFDDTVGALIRDMVGSGRPVRAYGEMVARLWADGNASGAIELERLWNGLGESAPFALFCAYPRTLMSGDEGADGFGEVCALHSRVLAAAPVPPGVDTTWRFPASPEAARRARHLVDSTVSEWALHDVRDAAVLAAAELAANAVLHAEGDFTVSLARLPGRRVRLLVGDTEAERVAPTETPTLAVNGRGLSIVEALADDWGCDLQDGGKVVWAEFSGRRGSAAG